MIRDAAKGVDDCELTILMPCLDEARTLRICIEKALGFLQRAGVHGEVLVADNGSADGSPEIARRCGARVIEVAAKGYGNAIIGGIGAARGRYIIMGDADDSYDFAALAPFLARLRDGHELVMGNRFRGGIKPRAMPFLHRYFGNPLLSAIGRVLFGNSCGDFQCGLRGFDRAAMVRLGLAMPGMEFACEMVVKATLHRLKITEVPITLWPDGRDRRAHLRPWRDGWRTLRFLLLFSPRWLFLYPGILLVAAGLLGSLAVLPGPLRIGSINFDVHTLLFSASSIIVGFQAVQFWLFARLVAVSVGLVNTDRLFERLRRAMTLEVGLGVGFLLLLAGAAGSILAVLDWQQAGFGPLSPPRMMRLAIPSATLAILGCQVIYGAFFLAILKLRHRLTPDDRWTA